MKHSGETIADRLLATRPGSYGVYAMRRLLNRTVLEIDGVKLHASLDAWSPRKSPQPGWAGNWKRLGSFPPSGLA